jgi:hypothetical protein
MNRACLLALAVMAPAAACAARDARFPLREPLHVDTDLQSVSVPCRREPDEKDPHHVSCAPREYVSPIIWDGADNLLFRPLAEVWAFRAASEAANATSVDEVADSSWFTNRIGARPMSNEELVRGACTPSDILDPDSDPDGSWLIDHGKTEGSSLGFRVKIHGRKYLFKVDTDSPERPSAASTIGAAVYNAVGFETSCEQIVYFRPSLLTLKPGLKYKGNFDGERPFDQAALDRIMAKSPRRDGKARFQASAWLPGKLLGPFRYLGTRQDDPNDVIPHEDRRELRGGRVLAAWLDHFDAREENSMDSWIADRKDVPDSSPGHVVHYYLDTSDCLGSGWDWDQITRRLGHSYVVDWNDIELDFVTLGIPRRPWDRVRVRPGFEAFNYFDVDNFDPERWKNEYANPAFDRTTERDAAWMTRILARLTPANVRALAEMARFTWAGDTEILTRTLQGRLDKIMERYLLRLSPLSDVQVQGDDLCAVDLAEQRQLRAPDAFHYDAVADDGLVLPVRKEANARVCVSVPHGASTAGAIDGSAPRYTRVAVKDGVAHGPLVAHLYDMGQGRGFVLVGLERPEGGAAP